MRQEFKMLKLRQQEDPDTQYIMNMKCMGSPSQDKANGMASRKALQSVQNSPVMHNNVRGRDPPFDNVWEDAIHDRPATVQEVGEEDNEATNINIQNNRRRNSPKNSRARSGHRAGWGGGNHSGGPSGGMASSTYSNRRDNSSGVHFGNVGDDDQQYHPQFGNSGNGEGRDRPSRSIDRSSAAQSNYGPNFGQDTMGAGGGVGFQPHFEKSAKDPPRKTPGIGGQGIGERTHTTVQHLLTVISDQEMEIEKIR